MNVPWVDPCAFSPSWQLARRKVRQNQACTEHNPSDWQLCPLVTVWLSPKLLYFTEIMIFYGHRFEDNCCILRVVVLQGDTAASFRGEEGGKKKLLSLFSLSPPLSFPHLSFFYLFIYFIYFYFLQSTRAPILTNEAACPIAVSLGGGQRAVADIPALSPTTSHGDNTILQWSMKEQTFRRGDIGGGGGERGLWRNSLHMVAVHLCLVACCPDGQICWASGGCKKTSWARKGDKCQRQQWWRWFSKQPGADIQTQHLTLLTSLTLAPVDGFPLWSSTPKGVSASKNVATPEKMAFSCSGRTQSENMNCLCPKELVMHYQMKCFFLGKMLSKVSFAKEDISQDR